MRQFAAVLILVAVFIVLVGTQFHTSDGEKLAAIGRLVAARVEASLPPTVNLMAPLEAVRRHWPMRLEERVRHRLTTDQRLAGLDLTVTAEGSTIRLRGVVPDARTRKVAVSLAENTVGVAAVIDELAVPENRIVGKD